MTAPSDIDALLAAPKALAGAAAWTIDGRGSVAGLAVPVAGRGIVGDLFFHAAARVRDPAQGGSCALVCEGRPVQRLWFRPDHAHANPFGPGVGERLRGLRFPAGASRLHRWSENRAWPRARGDEAGVAEPTAAEPDGLDGALALFLRLCAVEGDLPPAPWEPRLL